MNQQASKTILMVRPANFGFNPETKDDNAFQNSKHIHPDISKAALIEFDNYVQTLKQEHVNIIVIQDSNYPLKPDAIFPNNWFTTHQDGTLITYPMLSEIRRLERTNPIIETLKGQYKIKHHLNFEQFEKEYKYLEGTGSIVFDHDIKKAFMCSSERSNTRLFTDLCSKIKYQPVIFNAYDEQKRSIYHTNVMMSITSKLNILCLETIPDEEEDALIEELSQEKELLIVDYEQMKNFCCNVLELQNNKGESLLTMSTRAYNSFEEDQLDLIEKYHKIVHSPLTTIENIGGGGSRCMMAQIYFNE